jgi:tetratricopeptide (TPR) repeat protein
MGSEKKGRILFVLFIIALIMRKTGLVGSSVLLYSVVILLSYHLLKESSNQVRVNVLLVIFLIISLFFLQSWIPSGRLGVIVLISWIVFISLSFKIIIGSRFRISFCILISFVLITAALFNVRSFHNFYRSTYYEEYIRSKYTEQEGILADLYIDKHKNIEKHTSELVLKMAFEADSFNKNDLALKLYNQAIDLDPDNANAYHRRGFLKLTKLELDIDMAYSAIKDFDRAIHLQEDFTLAYFHRYLAEDYLDLKGRAFLDRKKVWEADSLLSETDFLKKYGISKTSFSKPFYP